MRVYECDRCGKEIDPMGNYSVSVKNPTWASNIDLCPDCLKSFKRLLKGKEEEQEGQE